MQIFSTPNGPMLKVRTEKRDGCDQPEHLFVGADERVVVTRWMTEVPDEFELIHDPVARAEANVARLETDALIAEKKVLLECLSVGLAIMDEQSAEQVRDLYRERIKKLPLVSLTK